jgi:polyribonucleotide nucleotidyltransferase
MRPLSGGQRVESVEDVLNVGQKIQVEINEIDDRGKLSLIPVVEETVVGVSLLHHLDTTDAARSA